jgi:hypothetical protein
MPFLPSKHDDLYIRYMLNKNVDERAITDIILNYKNEMDYLEIIQYYYGNWRDISKSKHINNDFIRKYRDKIDWFTLCFHHKLDDSIIMQFSHKLGWENICRYQSLSTEFIKRNIEHIDFNLILRHQILSPEFIKEYIDYFDLREIFHCQIIDEELFHTYINILIERYGKNYFNHFLFSFQHKTLPVSIWKKYKHLIDWTFICKEIELTEEFMEYYKTNLYWRVISKYQKLSTNFIKRNFKRLYLPYIIQYQFQINIDEHKTKFE